MPLTPGSRLGPYEILAPLGAGGMGEVYRARDPRLGREVAIKVLPVEVSADSGRLRRFEKEARAASALNHPNIVTIHDIGTSDSTSWIAMERVDGATLREVLASGPLPAKRLLPIAAQIADGLACAHQAGIIHRDLKPENVMVTKDGLVKILDFGLVKLEQPEADGAASEIATVTRATEPGIIVGTVGYMSPEQASAKAVDYRSDQFSLGSLLYELASGRPAFTRKTRPETLAAIIRDEPEPLANLDPKTPVPLRWIIERCLAKEPRQRYASTEDLARDLGTLRDHLSEATASDVFAAPSRALATGRYAVAVLGLLIVVGLSYWAGNKRVEGQPPSYHRLTYRRGNIVGARFSPDGQTIVYSAGWDGQPLETFLMRRESSEARSLGYPGARLLSVSSAAELALGIGWKSGVLLDQGRGTLARVPLAGGAPREVLEKVGAADWSPDGKSLAVVRRRQGKSLLEFPSGHVLYETVDRILDIRVAPKGNLVAVIEEESDGASVAIVDSAGKKRQLAGGWFRAQGLAWSPRADEIWFTASRAGQARALWAVSLSGHDRVVTRVPGRLALQDIASDGRVLLTHETVRREMVGLAPGESRERVLTWLGYSFPSALSRDGRTVLFQETSEENPLAVLYVRRTDGSLPVRIGETGPMHLSDFSPDGRWVVAVQPDGKGYQLLPTGAGEAKPLSTPGLEELGDARWFPDGARLFFAGRTKGEKSFRDYVVDLAGGSPHPITPEGIAESVISPDGKSFLNDDGQEGLSIYPVEGGPARQVLKEAPGFPIQWSADGKSVYLWNAKDSTRVDRLDLASGRTEPWKEFRPSDPTGVVMVGPLLVAPDGKSYVYSYVRVLSDLYLVEGLK